MIKRAQQESNPDRLHIVQTSYLNQPRRHDLANTKHNQLLDLYYNMDAITY